MRDDAEQPAGVRPRATVRRRTAAAGDRAGRARPATGSDVRRRPAVLALAAAGLGLAVYLLGFFGDVSVTSSFGGPLLVGGGLLAGTAVLPQVGRVLVPGGGAGRSPARCCCCSWSSASAGPTVRDRGRWSWRSCSGRGGRRRCCWTAGRAGRPGRTAAGVARPAAPGLGHAAVSPARCRAAGLRAGARRLGRRATARPTDPRRCTAAVGAGGHRAGRQPGHRSWSETADEAAPGGGRPGGPRGRGRTAVPRARQVRPAPARRRGRHGRPAHGGAGTGRRRRRRPGGGPTGPACAGPWPPRGAPDPTRTRHRRRGRPGDADRRSLPRTAPESARSGRRGRPPPRPSTHVGAGG